jgi:hypothetical protein
MYLVGNTWEFHFSLLLCIVYICACISFWLINFYLWLVLVFLFSIVYLDLHLYDTVHHDTTRHEIAKILCFWWSWLCCWSRCYKRCFLELFMQVQIFLNWLHWKHKGFNIPSMFNYFLHCKNLGWWMLWKHWLMILVIRWSFVVLCGFLSFFWQNMMKIIRYKFFEWLNIICLKLENNYDQHPKTRYQIKESHSYAYSSLLCIVQTSSKCQLSSSCSERFEGKLIMFLILHKFTDVINFVYKGLTS